MAFIVVTFGGTQRRLDVAVVAAALALVVVLAAGLVIRAPLARVPENTIKFVVGLLLTTFGVFWAGEGTGVNWPGSDLALPVILAFLAVVAAILTRWLRDRGALQPGAAGVRRLSAFAAFWWDFVVGDDWRVALGSWLRSACPRWSPTTGFPAWWVLPVAVALVLGPARSPASSAARADRRDGGGGP